ncbi:hypothetical protein E4U13_006306 [Claviceps humidiphila]|uniref:BTB domain-containing protein n=1 Tax=Claviceps humidiphila TaxID=1294629 RepID=A0A9P7TN26_9HYPO|nr:hypothetical protein E4U32_001247 [Claviceps aff. humidiphila group G2b]KAG6108784.1 hypothetical protein E4U13_006306 [Claviceps humidiphila]
MGRRTSRGVTKSKNAKNASNLQVSKPEGIFTSQPFKFVVGEAKTEFLLHSVLVASKSEALGRLINGGFVEGQQGYVVLEDEDAKTVAAFAEFIYTGDYKLSFDFPQADGHCANQSHRGWPEPGNEAWLNFCDGKDFEILPAVGDDDSAVKPLREGGMATDYSEFFIAHAKVFVFADYYGVVELMNLSMARLHKALCLFRLSSERIGDILALVRFCYERPGPDRLKKLVASYSAAVIDPCVSEDVAQSFQELLKERGDFAADIAWFMACRLMTGT